MEIVLRHRAGKLPLPLPPETRIPSRWEFFQLENLPLTETVIFLSGKLPDGHHDPFGRRIAAHATGAGSTQISPNTPMSRLGASRIW